MVGVDGDGVVAAVEEVVIEVDPGVSEHLVSHAGGADQNPVLGAFPAREVVADDPVIVPGEGVARAVAFDLDRRVASLKGVADDGVGVPLGMHSDPADAIELDPDDAALRGAVAEVDTRRVAGDVAAGDEEAGTVAGAGEVGRDHPVVAVHEDALLNLPPGGIAALQHVAGAVDHQAAGEASEAAIAHRPMVHEPDEHRVLRLVFVGGEEVDVLDDRADVLQGGRRKLYGRRCPVQHEGRADLINERLVIGIAARPDQPDAELVGRHRAGDEPLADRDEDGPPFIGKRVDGRLQGSGAVRPVDGAIGEDVEHPAGERLGAGENAGIYHQMASTR